MRFQTLLAFVALTSIAFADDSIVERLQKTGVHIELALVDDDGELTVPNAMVIPNDWRWTDQTDGLIREWISTLDTPLILYINGPWVPKRETVENLENDFPDLSVKWPFPAALGVLGEADSDACQLRTVVAGSPAASAGLKAGDTIVGVNEKAINNFKMLKSALGELNPGESVEILVKREGKVLKFQVTLGGIRVRDESSDALESSKSPSAEDAAPIAAGDP